MHARLAHVGAASVGRVHKQLTQADLAVIHTCPQCLEAKMVRRSYLSVSAALKATRPGEFVSADILNPSATSVGGAKYLLVIIDQYTGFIEVYAQKFIHPTIGEVNLPHFIRDCHNSFGVRIGTLRADLGPEFVTTILLLSVRLKALGRSSQRQQRLCKTDR